MPCCRAASGSKYTSTKRRVILFLLKSNLEEQLASVGIAFHQLMRQSRLLQWERIGDSNVDLARHDKINGSLRGRD